LKEEPGVVVEVKDGQRGEFTVSVDDRVVARKGESLPSVADVLAAVRNAGRVGVDA